MKRIALPFVLAFALAACGSRTMLEVDDYYGNVGDDGPSNVLDGGDGAVDGGDREPPPRDGNGHLTSCRSRLPGPALVTHTDYFGKVSCIDQTEVTNAQYAEFLAASGAPSQAAPCAWNTSYVPEFEWPARSDHGDYPVVDVDWCDAVAFCAWSGKHLCAHHGPDAANPALASDPALDEWAASCGSNRAEQYPYSAVYNPVACNGKDLGLARTTPVKTPSTCQGADPGLYGMSGNVWEWEDACAGGSDDAECLVRGGSFRSDALNLRCTAAEKAARSSKYDDFGFRCCID